jgi:hypothetical protein
MVYNLRVTRRAKNLRIVTTFLQVFHKFVCLGDLRTQKFQKSDATSKSLRSTVLDILNPIPNGLLNTFCNGRISISSNGHL